MKQKSSVYEIKVNQFYCFETTEKPVHHFCIVKLNDLRCYKSLKDRLKSCYTRGHNVLELFNVLAKFPFNTSKVGNNIQHSKDTIQVVSRFAQQIKTQNLRKLGNIGKRSKLGGDRTQCPVFPPEIRLLQQQSKIMQKYLSKFSVPLHFRLICLLCSKQFALDFQCKQTSVYNLSQSPTNFSRLVFFINSVFFKILILI